MLNTQLLADAIGFGFRNQFEMKRRVLALVKLHFRGFGLQKFHKVGVVP